VTSPIAGPAVEVQLRPHPSVEVDALHKPLRERYDTTYSNGLPSRSGTFTDATSWQFPELAKYRFSWSKVAPFVEAGPSFRLPQEMLPAYGASAGAGVQVHFHALRIAPALRFTRWQEAAGAVAANEASVLVEFSLGGAQLTVK
jgi:hypothetical protein